MPINEQLTLVLLTEDRPAFLRRAMLYYAELPCRVLVIDSSQAPASELAQTLAQVDYRHVPQFHGQARQQKIALTSGSRNSACNSAARAASVPAR